MRHVATSWADSASVSALTLIRDAGALCASHEQSSPGSERCAESGFDTSPDAPAYRRFPKGSPSRVK